MSESTHTLFCDETGSTGSRFYDPAQPIYAEGGWFVAHKNRHRAAETLLKAEKRFSSSAGELKGADLAKRARGHSFLRSACEAAGKAGGVPFIIVVEKKYAICSKIVETFFDPDYNPRIPFADTWDPWKRQADAELFYSRDDSLIVEFAEAYRLMDTIRLKTNAENWATLFRMCGLSDEAERVRGVLPNLDAQIEIDRGHLTSGRFPSGMDSLILFVVSDVFQFVEQKCPFPTDIVHDQTASFEPLYHYVFALYSKGDPLAVKLNDGREVRMGFKNALSLSFQDSKASPLIRAADYLLAGTRKFVQLALGDEQIPHDLTRVAFGTLGPFLLKAYAAEHPSTEAIPELTRIMASRSWNQKVLGRLHREIPAALNSTAGPEVLPAAVCGLAARS